MRNTDFNQLTKSNEHSITTEATSPSTEQRERDKKGVGSEEF